METQRDRARDLGAGEEGQGLRVDDRQERGLGALRRADAEKHTVVFRAALRSRDEQRLTEYECGIAERRRPDVDLPVSRSTLTIDELYAPPAW